MDATEYIREEQKRVLVMPYMGYGERETEVPYGIGGSLRNAL